MKMHWSVTPERILEAAEEQMTDTASVGICTECGEDYDGVCEPDAREYRCSACGAHKVYGAEELLLMTA